LSFHAEPENQIKPKAECQQPVDPELVALIKYQQGQGTRQEGDIEQQRITCKLNPKF